MAILLFIVFSFVFSFSRGVNGVSGDAMWLLSFKESVVIDSSNLLSNWRLTVSYCDWYGVTCDEVSGRVIGLNITGSLNSRLTESGSYIAGTLTPSIGNLTELRRLCIPYNLFSGEIPVEIMKLRVLEVLELQGNNFSGMIPDQISYLQSLRVLNLSNNLISGSIPDRLIGGRLGVIDLSNNQLSGGIRFDGLGRCKYLNHLKLSNNFLIGNIPPGVRKCRNLRTLLLDGNILEGPIPGALGRVSELRVLDVSRNSLTDRIPKELANCRKLSVVVLTNLVEFSSTDDSSRGEFNAFAGEIPSEVLLLPSLQILWVPRANLGGQLPSNWTTLCSLRILNLGQNYITGEVPERMGMCRNLSFLDLSSNNLQGYLPSQLQVPCMLYFNVSRNNISGSISSSGKSSCDTSMIYYEQGPGFLDTEDIQNAYSSIPLWGSQMSTLFGFISDDNFVVIHDFSWNSFNGSLPLFSVGDRLVETNRSSYRLLLNNNMFDGPLPGELVSHCNDLNNFSVNLSMNQISGSIYQALLLDCLQLTEFEAGHNQIGGSIGPGIGDSMTLQLLDLRGNRLSGPLPDQLGMLKKLKWMYLGQNNITGTIPSELSKLTSLLVLDLSQNAVTGSIPASLSNASALETVLLDHNQLAGEIPSSFSNLSSLTVLDVSFNNLSGYIPRLQHVSDCVYFKGNRYLHSCPDTHIAPPIGFPVPFEVHKSQRRRLSSFLIAAITSASVVLCIVIVFAIIIGRRKLSTLASVRRKVLVTFTDAPSELNYTNLVRATGSFSIRNLIGTGGFGSTYKAELIPGFLVAVKRLSIGRFQGLEQFDAEIRTLGRIRHKNLVTLIGYYVGEAEMFLIYNYLSGGNLETFIHNRSDQNVQWPVIHKIAIDIAQALTYLHYSCVPRIVHRDIKPSNILLDKEHNAYLSDFGLARLLEVSKTHATTDVAGTFGYLAPEYATTCRVSDKADVYSFGVVLLELMSGKKSLDPSFSNYGNGFNIVPWAELLIKEGRSSELFSPELWEAGPKEGLLGMLMLASSCTVESLSVRPSMKQVLEKLKQLKS